MKMKVSMVVQMQIYLTLLHGVIRVHGGAPQTTTEKPTSVESRELVKARKSTKSANSLNQASSIALNVTPRAQNIVTQLKEIVPTGTCQVRRSEKAVKLQVAECRQSGPTKGKKRMVRVDAETRQTIMTLYGGMFYSQETAIELEASRQRVKPRPKVRVGRSTDPEHDGNMCCPSLSTLEAAPAQMLNSFLQLRDIVHFETEGIYQYINTGYCVPLSEQSCNGLCVVETRIVYLLVWKDPLPNNSSLLPMTFEPFDIPSFCSCKNISP